MNISPVMCAKTMIFHDDFSRVTHCVPPILTKEIAITECEPNIAEPCPPNCFTLPPISAGTVDDVIVE